MFEYDDKLEKNPTIKVIGVGDGGCDAVDAMLAGNMKLVDFIAVNTNANALRARKAPNKIQIGTLLTKGLGTGTKPDVGRKAALEEIRSLESAVEGADMVFIAACLGGGTGTGAAPVIAGVARKMGALTVGVVTKPFTYEGKSRTAIAEQGITELKKNVDALIVIPNDRLINIASKNTLFIDAFKPSDDVLRQAVQGIVDLISTPGQINLDFADVRHVMSERGMAVIGIGIGVGKDRASDAVHAAISNPLLDDNSISGAKGVIVNITGSDSMTIDDYETISRIIHEKMHMDAKFKFGMVRDDSMAESIKVTVIATGFNDRFDADRHTKLHTLPHDR